MKKNSVWAAKKQSLGRCCPSPAHHLHTHGAARLRLRTGRKGLEGRKFRHSPFSPFCQGAGLSATAMLTAVCLHTLRGPRDGKDHLRLQPILRQPHLKPGSYPLQFLQENIPAPPHITEDTELDRLETKNITRNYDKLNKFETLINS